jgi:hypothetical protein
MSRAAIDVIKNISRSEPLIGRFRNKRKTAVLTLPLPMIMNRMGPSDDRSNQAHDVGASVASTIGVSPHLPQVRPPDDRNEWVVKWL